ncbi:MAG TPA: ABC transporter ATP-binding protein [Methylomirabilota bacterium]
MEALRGVDLVIRSGEVVAMLGPNGAGKTTSISLMLGLRRPTSGEVRLFGLPPTDRRARSRCGVMLQESGTTAVLTVAEIVDVFRAYYPAPLPVDRAIAMAGLASQAGARVGTLSGGQRQRLYFALAICGDPEILFLDEPTAGMDVEARRAFVASIQTLAAAGKTIVFTSHYLREAEELAQRIVVIDRGTVIADASPGELKARVPGKKITLVAGRPLATADLDGLPASIMSLDRDRATLLSNEPATVLRELFRRGVDLVDLEVSGADLEEAFLALTRRPEAAAR